MKSYCASCGEPTEYTLKRPNLCCFCGQSFSTNIKHKVSSATVPSRRIATRIEEDEEIEPDLDLPDKLDVSIEIEPRQTEKLSQIFGSGAIGFERPVKTVDSKIVLAEFRANNAPHRQ